MTRWRETPLVTNRDAIWRVTSGWADEIVLTNWRVGADTHAIARHLTVPESYVANRLAFLMDEERENEAFSRGFHDSCLCASARTAVR